MIASHARIMLLTGMIPGIQLAGANADDPPLLNVGRSCDAAAGAVISLGRDKQACMQEEGGAQDLLTKNWSQYLPADKTLCVGMVSKGGPPSYVELLACLEIMKDAAAIHNDDPGDDAESVNSIVRQGRQSKAPRDAYSDTGIGPSVARPTRR
jgi:hypothetical protein